MSLIVEDYLDEFEKFLDLLFTNTDEAIVKFTVNGIVARNMDSNRVTAYTLSAPPKSFYAYRIDRESFGLITNRSRVKGVIRALRATGANRAAIRRKDNKIMLDETEIGEFEDEKTDFDVPEFKIELPNRITFDGRSLKRFLAQARKAGADAVGFAWLLTRREAAVAAFNEEVWLTFKDLFGLEIFQDAGAGYKIHLIEQFLPPTIFLRKPWPVVKVLGARAYRMPVGLEYDFGTVNFKAYVAPNYDDSARFLEKLGLLRALTKEDILRQVGKEAPTAVSLGEIEEALTKEGYEITKVEEMLRQLAKEGKLNVREAGWKKLYFLPDRPPVLKPLTEDIVLSAIRDFLEAADTDAVGYSELESFLAREYLTDPLHSMLLGLKAKGLIESKPWPTRRPGGYAVDMRGYWTIKPTEPVEAVKQAEEKSLKPLTKEVVFSTLKDTNMEVKARVSFDDIAGRLADEGYDVTKLGDVLTELRKEEKVSVDLAGKWFVKDIEEKIRRLHTLELWLEKIKTVGVRDPQDPTKFLPPEHPLSMLEARKVEADVRLLKEEITDEEYRREIQEIDKEMEKVRREFEVPPPVVEIPTRPPVPPGYAKVRFLRDMVRFIGTDRKVYGPFRAHEEAVIPMQHAEIFEKHRYIEVTKQGGASTHRSSNPQTPFMDMEKQPITMEYRLLEYGVLE